MKRLDFIILVIVSMLTLILWFKLLPVMYVAIATMLLLMGGALFYSHLKGQGWTTATLLILFGLFGIYELYYVWINPEVLVDNSINFDIMNWIYALLLTWIVATSVGLLHWAYSILRKMTKPPGTAVH